MNNYIAKYCMFYPVVFMKNENVAKYFRKLDKSQWFQENEIREIQNEKYIRILKYAKDYIPFYINSLENVNTDLDSIKNNDIPFLTKDNLKYDKNSLRSKNSIFFKSVKTTGGSTGEPVTIIKESKAMAMERAAAWRGYSWAGIEIGDKQARFWGMPLESKKRFEARLIDIVNNRIRASAFNFDESELYQYYRKFSMFKPKYVYGYVSLVKIFGEFLADNNLRVPKEIKAIITTAEELTIDDRKSIEKNYGAKVYNEYGSGEIGTVAHECEKGNLHVNSENVHVEIVDNKEEICQPGEFGQLVITELNNYLQPLIRYKTGDLAKISNKKCRCGRQLPILEGVFGRAYDVITTPEGKKFHPAFFNYIFKEANKKKLTIKQFQILQTSMTNIVIKIVPYLNYSLDVETMIRKIINDKMSRKFNIEFQIVDNILRERSGKFRLVKAFDGH